MSKKTVDELTQERDTLLAEIAQLEQTKKAKDSGDNSAEELLAVKKENESLRELVEKYQGDLTNATKFAQQLMLEKGSRVEQEPETQDKTPDEIAIEDANKALEDYLNSKGENNNDK